MSHAARRRSGSSGPAGRFGARATASLAALTLAAAVVVPVALAPDDSAGHAERAAAGRAAATAGKAPGAGAATGTATGSIQSAPDQIRQREWHLDAMHVPKAWKWSKGQGVTVAVLDTGVDKRHPDLTGRVTTGPDLTGGARRPGGKFWGLHGTSMASIIAGHGNGPGFQRGVMGVAPQSRILSIRVTWENDDPLRNNGGTSARNRDAVAQGIRYAVDQGADVINMSLGGGRLFYDGDKTEEEAVRYALSKNVVLIASAGNDGAGPNRRNYPAAYSGVIAVGALDNRGRVWKDSNRRSYVAVCAPGVEIVSADANNGYVVGTGTSPSSAIAAGVAALVRARYPQLTPTEVRDSLVQGSVQRQGTVQSNCPGTLDAARALVAAHKINKTSHGPGAAPKPATKSSPAAEAAPAEEGTSKLVAAVLGGGGVLVLVGLVLGWRQRRRPGDDEDDYDEVEHDYLSPSPSAGADRPREPVGAMTGGVGGGGPAPDVVSAPVHVPLWQSGEVFPGGSPTPGPEPSHDRRPYAGDPQSYSSDPQPYSADAQPYAGDPEPYSSDERPYGAEARPYGSESKPYGSSAQPYAADAQPYGTDAQSYNADAQPYGTGAQASGAGAQPFGADAQAYGTGAQPSGADPQPYGTGAQPYGADAQPYGADVQPYGADVQASGADAQAHGTDAQAYGSDEQPFSGDAQSHESGERPYGSASQPYGSEAQPYGSGAQPYGSGERTYGSEAQPYSSDERPYSGDAQPYGADERPYGSAAPSFGSDEQGHGSDRPPYGSSDAGPYGSDPLASSGGAAGPAAFKPGDLRPYVPADTGGQNGSNGHNGNGNGHNGNGNANGNGHTATGNGHAATGNGHGGGNAFDDDPLDDNDWQRFRRHALEDQPFVLPQADEGGETPKGPTSPVPPADEPSPGSFPAVPPVPPAELAGDDPFPSDRPRRRPRPPDEDDYRPPWW
ncbi:S8 family serine peptidase [Spirillospora sp. NPDC047279]|uniref:S8 family serine peptidase n=1 Tax=Spirillospora sp. NPDC047279 TaxID=3155478 RepID=UPI0033CA9E04